MDKNISFGQAFSHCFSMPLYWLWIVLTIISFIAMWIISGTVGRKKNVDVSNSRMIFGIIFAFLFAIAAFGWPFSIKWNTTKAEAAKGQYIGF